MSGLLPPPRLTRSFATEAVGLVRPNAESARLMRQITTAYANLPFKGRALTLPGGAVAADDVWRCQLEDELEECLQAGTLTTFSLEVWLANKVQAEGSYKQRTDLAALRARLDEDLEIIDDGYSGLPNDITAVVHQPLTEIEVYRDLSDVVDVGDHHQDLDDDDDDDDDA